MLHLRLIEPASHREFNFLVFECGKNIRLGDGLNSLVVNAANNRLLANNENHGFPVWPVGGIFDLRTYVVEKSSIREGPDIVPNRFDVVGITWLRGNQRSYGICLNAPIADNVKALDDVLRLSVSSRLLSGERLGHDEEQANAGEEFEFCN